MDERWPDFLIIGAAKSGTTALYTFLGRHPDIYMSPEKEPGFFAFEGDPLRYHGPWDDRLKEFVTTTSGDYLNLFSDAGDARAAGEASVVYLYNPDAPGRIKRYIPDAKLIAILRNPVERAFSHFMDHRRHRREPINDFVDALERETERIAGGWEWSWHYMQIGFYSRQVQRYLDRFETHQMRFYLYEDFLTDPEALLQDIYRFLDVDPSFSQETSERHNVSGTPRSAAVERFLKGSSPTKELVKKIIPETSRRKATRSDAFMKLTRRRETIDPSVASRLTETYRSDILRLQELIGRDLSGWLEQRG